jgi:thiamine-phosphate pyrophosphorylase
MFAFKYKYYLYIGNTKDFNPDLIKRRNKFIIIYRNNIKRENIKNLRRFRQLCKKRGIKLYIANDIFLANLINADGLYVSAFNKSLKHLNKINKNFQIIGSAHNYKEIITKKKQGCSEILFSRLFKTNYKNKTGFLGIVKFNLLTKLTNARLIPLGGIRLINLNSLKLVNSNAISILSEIKKKPAITSRLF